MIRGIRGAVGVSRNTREGIVRATGELLGRLVAENGLRPEALSLALFTVTSDLTAAAPAAAARKMGWTHVPLLCMAEPKMRGAARRIVRVLILAETRRSPGALHHLYLGRAAALRPDLNRSGQGRG
ncbi:MAG: chorismate mutase [Planctomycetes bacterium]|nr:chorismate mutase [Planctomycetota bacterium]